MSLARIIWAVSLIAAVVLAFVSSASFTHGGAIIAILGLISGWFVDHEHRLGMIVAAIFLAGGATAWGAIPGIGDHLTSVLGSIGGLLAAASATAILRRMVERIFLGKTNTA